MFLRYFIYFYLAELCSKLRLLWAIGKLSEFLLKYNRELLKKIFNIAEEKLINSNSLAMKLISAKIIAMLLIFYLILNFSVSKKE